MQTSEGFRVVWKAVGGWPQTRVCRSRLETELVCESLGPLGAMEYVHIEHLVSVSQWAKVIRLEPLRGAAGPGRPAA